VALSAERATPPLRAARWLLALGVLGAAVAATPPPSLPTMAPPGPHDRILIVSPHPDDETLCCAGLLLRARAAGAATAIVWVTAGDSFRLDAIVIGHSIVPHRNYRLLGERRLEEAQAAAAVLGIPPAQRYFLGYPDRGVEPMMQLYFARAYTSPYTGLHAVPFAQALSPDASYTGANLESDLIRVLDQFRPTLVFAAAPQDLHPDHRGSGEIVKMLLERRGELGELRYWIVHARDWPPQRGYYPEYSLTPPASTANLHWESLPLDGAERAVKLAALRAHRSQMTLTSSFMLSFVRANEIFATAP
jgi:LmbE family N-acetylglucosaminyl deacetylase